MLPVLRNGGSVPAPTQTPYRGVPSQFDNFFNDIDRWFNESFFAPLTAPAWSALPLSMWEDENHVCVEVDAPGMKKDDIDVSVYQDALIIRGERKRERKNGGYDTRGYGQFEHRVTLPCEVDADQVDAKLTDGVLAITFPKSESAKPRKIALKTD